MNKVKLSISLLILCLTFSLQAQINSIAKVNPEVAPVMTFKNTLYDWGTIKEGEKTAYTFEFTNTGKTDLIITKIKGSCGCTVPSNWKKEPIKPNESSSFQVTFNSRNKPNKQSKTITVSCNTNSGRERVRITGVVTPDPELAKLRVERAAKRKEMAAKRKLERQKLATQKQVSLKEEKLNQKAKVESKKEINTKEKQVQEKKLKKEVNKRKKAERAVKKETRKAEKAIELQEKFKKVTAKVKKEESKLLKMNKKLTKLEAKGKLSPNDIVKRKEAIAKQLKTIDKVKMKLEKVKNRM